jgi:hypothetical protein
MIRTGKYWREETEVPRHCNQVGHSQSASPGPIGPRSRASRKWEGLRCAPRVLQCQGRGHEDAEALHGRSRMCTRYGHLFCGWRRGDGVQRCGGVDSGDRTAGPGLDRGRGWGQRVVLRWGLAGGPDGVSGDRRAGGFLRHPSSGWAGDDSGADSGRRRVDAGDCLAPDPHRDGLRTRAGLHRRRPGRTGHL